MSGEAEGGRAGEWGGDRARGKGEKGRRKKWSERNDRKGLGAQGIVQPHLRPYRDEPSASRPIRADKHRRGQRVLTWVTSREHCAAAGIITFLLPRTIFRNMCFIFLL